MSRHVCFVAVACILCGAFSTTALAQPSNQMLEQCELGCEAGERVVGLALEVGPARSVHRENPRCGHDYDGRNVDYAVQGLRTASAQAAATGAPHAFILSMAAREIGLAVQQKAPGALARLLSGVTGDGATCRTLAVAIPTGLHITRVQTTLTTPARTSHPSGRCGLFRVASTTTSLPDHRCVADDAVFGDPSVTFFGFETYRIDARSGIVAVTAKNWSEQFTRVAYLRVYYK
jgi:hypothetical protein